MDKRLAELEAMLHRGAPLTAEMGVKVAAFDGAALRLTADFERNINIHGAAFGGSLFSICAVACWGLLTLLLEERERAEVVLSHAEITYHRPVRGAIEVTGHAPDEASLERFHQTLRRRGMARLAMEACVGRGGECAATFTGEYAAITKK